MSTMIAERFEVLSELESGDGHVVYRAQDSDSGVEVLLLEHSLVAGRWSSPDEFDEEAQVLLQLEHATIPKFIGAFTEDERAYLAQEFVDGPTLKQLLDDGKTWNETEVVRDATAVLQALSYLHSLDPPVAHGAICATHLARRPDGRIAMLGFDRGGDATCADDLPAVGRTMVQLLTGREPAELFDSDGNLLIEELDVAPALAEVLRRMTTSVDRYEEAATVLDDLGSLAAKTAPLKPPPEDTAPVARPKIPKPSKDLAATAPLAAPRPVPSEDLHATAPLAAPKPVPLPEPADDGEDGEDGEDDAVLYYRRTKNFPKWSTVEPTAQGEFVIEFETRDLEERRLEISIVDKLELLDLRTYVNRGKREAARKKRVLSVFGAGIVAAVAMYFVYAPILPLVIVATLGGVFAMMLKNDEADERPAVHLTITPDELELVRRDEFRLRAVPRNARWHLERNTELMLTTDRAVPALELSREARIQADWFWNYIGARCQEIGSRRGVKERAAPPPEDTTAPVQVNPLEAPTAEHPLSRRKK